MSSGGMTPLRRLFAAFAAVVSIAAAQPDTLDHIADDYVQLMLRIGEADPGFVDAYYGPPEWAAAAKTAPHDLPTLKAETADLRARLDRIRPDDPQLRQRADFLRGQLRAAAMRLRIVAGEKPGFLVEAREQFGTAPELKPLSDYDPILARIETLVPGPGTLATRVDAFQNRFNIPDAKLRPALDAGIAECRRRTIAHIRLPANEEFELALVKDKPWSGYNYYQGNAKSRIEINTDLPIRASRVVDLGCHEGYPGHHVYNALLEQKLSRGRGWREFTVYPLYSPQSLIAEGSANYGIRLAFPGNDQVDFNRRTLFPQIGLPPAEAKRYFELNEAMRDLAGARFTITADYLDGKIDKAEAIRLTQKYSLVSPERAAQSIRFADTYRAYVINYGLGEDMVKAYVESAGPSQDARWQRMEQLLSNPMTPADLVPAAPQPKGERG
ncbi:MAG TPA: hypothetical protein VNR68_10810 [Sphingomicrobium sp.]|nr:hypothetical protein [Sphingomicrobium sp.]